MNQCMTGGRPIYSTFGADPDLGALVEMFVEEIPNRVTALRDAVDASDWESITRLAHQLKGAGGSYGFDEVTARAFVLETAARAASSSEAIRNAADALVDVCGRIRAGAP